MENKEELLNEKKYKKTKTGLVILALLIFIIGVCIGGYLIGTGSRKSKEYKNEQLIKSAKRTESQIQVEIDELKSNLASIESKKSQEFIKNQFSEEYNKLENEESKIQSQINDLEMEKWKSKSGYNSTKQSIELSKYIPYYMFGGFIIIASFMISGFVFAFAKRREITAFTTQQVMPVAQEGIEKMAPTIGNAAKEVVKGVKEGLKENQNGNAVFCKHCGKEIEEDSKFCRYCGKEQ